MLIPANQNSARISAGTRDNTPRPALQQTPFSLPQPWACPRSPHPVNATPAPSSAPAPKGFCGAHVSRRDTGRERLLSSPDQHRGTGGESGDILSETLGARAMNRCPSKQGERDGCVESQPVKPSTFDLLKGLSPIRNTPVLFVQAPANTTPCPSPPRSPPVCF